MIHIPTTQEEKLYYIQNHALSLTAWTFLGMTLAGLLTGLHAQQANFGVLNKGLVAISVLSAMTNAFLALIVYPLIFTWLSRRFKAPTETGEVRAAAAVSLWPSIVLLLMALIHPVPESISVIGALVSTYLFTTSLSLANGTTLWEAFRHVLAVWAAMILGICLLSLSLAMLKGHH